MSDQTEKPKDVLPKGYDAETPSIEAVKQKKFDFRTFFTVTPTDQNQREKDLQEYEANYLARVEKEVEYKPEESSDSLHVDLEISTEPTDDLGKLNLSRHTVTKRKKYLAERAEYEQRYISRYKEPKGKPSKKSASKIYKLEPKIKVDRNKERKEYERKFLARYKGQKEPKRSSNPKYGGDLGRLNLRKHTVTKRKKYLAERAEYEKKYVARYKQPKSKPRKTISSSLYKPEKPKPKRDMNKEREEYEKQYLARYQTRQKTKRKKKK